MESGADRFAVGYSGPNDISGWVAVLILWFALQVFVCSLASLASRHTFGLVFFESSFFAMFAGIAGYLLFTKNEKGVSLAKVYLIARLVGVVIEAATVGKTAVPKEAWAICMLVLWYLYLVRSRRIKAIYLSRAS